MVPRSNSRMCQQIPKACKYSGTHLFKTSKATITTTQKRRKNKEENGFGRRVVLVDGLVHMETGRKMSEKKVFSEKWSLTKGAVTRKYEEKGFRKRDLKQRWPFAKGSFSWKNPQEKGFRNRGSPLQRVHFHGRIRRRKVSEKGVSKERWSYERFSGNKTGIGCWGENGGKVARRVFHCTVPCYLYNCRRPGHMIAAAKPALLRSSQAPACVSLSGDHIVQDSYCRNS